MPVGIFQRLFELVMELLAAQAFKTVTLGHPGSNGSLKPRPNGSDASSCQVVQPMVQEVLIECGVSGVEVDVEQANGLNSSGPFVPPDLQTISIE